MSKSGTPALPQIQALTCPTCRKAVVGVTGSGGLARHRRADGVPGLCAASGMPAHRAAEALRRGQPHYLEQVDALIRKIRRRSSQ